MKRYITYILILFVASCMDAFSQDEEFFIENYLTEEVEVEDPIYMPVIGLGYGHLTFLGDIKNDYNSPLLGQSGFKLNIATFFERTHAYRLNFFFMGGKLTGNERNYEDLERNLNFQTDIFNFGVNVDYNFKTLLKPDAKIRPYISLGAGLMVYTPKTDLTTTMMLNGEENTYTYHYWADGTIRNIPQEQALTQNSIILTREYQFETDLRSLDRFNKGTFDEGKYLTTYSVFIPAEVGLDLKISNRVFLRIGYSFNYAFTDYIDDLGGEVNQMRADLDEPGTESFYPGVDYGGDIMNDYYSFLYTSLHLDLFSSAKTIRQEFLFAELETDETLLSDEDVDFILDVNDDCLGTPIGVKVDSVGCPYDDDSDGVPNYLDLEKATSPNAMVDENGVTYDIDDLITMLDFSDAVERSEVDIILANYNSGGRKSIFKDRIVPQRFKTVDSDDDGYISFEEVLGEINNFFDFNSELNTEDIYDLNQFFFEQ